MNSGCHGSGEVEDGNVGGHDRGGPKVVSQVGPHLSPTDVTNNSRQRPLMTALLPSSSTVVGEAFNFSHLPRQPLSLLASCPPPTYLPSSTTDLPPTLSVHLGTPRRPQSTHRRRRRPSLVARLPRPGPLPCQHRSAMRSTSASSASRPTPRSPTGPGSTRAPAASKPTRTACCNGSLRASTKPRAAWAAAAAPSSARPARPGSASRSRMTTSSPSTTSSCAATAACRPCCCCPSSRAAPSSGLHGTA